MIKGVIVVNKEEGYTSRDVVNIVSKVLNTKKVGHTGTLDPIATGVLVLVIGKYTKLVERLTALDKEYIGEIKLGIETDTLDITGNIIRQKEFKITKEDILKVFASFIGKYKMEVPKYSAIKVKGKKLYEYARNKEEVELPIKEVNIYSLELLDFHDDIIKFKAHVSKGTYIRSLIRDICQSLKVLGTMNSLVRTKQGNFRINEASKIEDIKKGDYQLLNIKDILNLKEYSLTKEEYFLVKNGNKIKLNSLEEEIYLTYLNKEVAIYQKVNDLYVPYIMLED